MWLHLLLACLETNKHILRFNRHHNVVWELHKWFMSNKSSLCSRLVNTRKHLNHLLLLACSCNIQKRHCNARPRPGILLVINHPHYGPPLIQPSAHILIQFVEITYCHDRLSTKDNKKRNKI